MSRARSCLRRPTWAIEIVSVLAREAPALVDEAIAEFQDMRPIVVSKLLTIKRAAEMSIALNHHLFDTLYHAVALAEGATRVTADERYFEEAKHLGNITRLADFRLPAA